MGHLGVTSMNRRFLGPRHSTRTSVIGRSTASRSMIDVLRCLGFRPEPRLVLMDDGVDLDSVRRHPTCSTTRSLAGHVSSEQMRLSDDRRHHQKIRRSLALGCDGFSPRRSRMRAEFHVGDRGVAHMSFLFCDHRLVIVQLERGRRRRPPSTRTSPARARPKSQMQALRHSLIS